MSVPDVSRAHNAFNFSRPSPDRPSKGASPNARCNQPLYSNHTSRCTHGHYATRVGRDGRGGGEKKEEKENCSSYLSHVAVLLVGAMRHRCRIGQQFARGNRPDRKKSRTGGRGARERAATRPASQPASSSSAVEIFGGLENSNSSASSERVAASSRTHGR